MPNDPPLLEITDFSAELEASKNFGDIFEIVKKSVKNISRRSVQA